MNSKHPKANGQLSFALVFESVMSLVYLAVAYILLSGQFNDRFNETFNDNIRLPLGVLFLIYGIFRIYRAIRKIKSTMGEKTNEEND
jgi:hypothetical protein